jgi:VanZ family protein
LSSSVKIRLVLLVYVLLVVLASLVPSSGVSVWHIDKIGHFLAYCGMALLASLSFHVRATRLVALLAAVGVGALLEWGQWSVPGRDMSLADGIANALGVGTGALLFRFRGHFLLDWARSRLGR